METKKTNLSQCDTREQRDGSSNRESLAALLKRWRQKLGFFSIFAAIPAMLVSHVQRTRADDAKKPEPSHTGQRARSVEKLNLNCSNTSLLKRQSEYRLPQQKPNFDFVIQAAGRDNCPGRPIPGGTYTAAAPFTDSGDTTGATDTVTALGGYYYYYNYDARGPDHVYSFTLTGIGSNPQIKVSRTSGSYRPLIYILQGGFPGGCPPGAGNLVWNWQMASWDTDGTAIVNSERMRFLPLNVPLHLFVDSPGNDAAGSGPYTVQMQDVTVASEQCQNPIDCSEFFVRQHYLDFLNREPEQSGLESWLNVMSNCSDVLNDPGCDRLTVSASFFGSQEFHLKGFFVYRFYQLAFNRLPEFAEIAPDMQNVTGQTPAEVFAKKGAFTNAFVQRPEFVNTYGGMSNANFVGELLARHGLESIVAPDPTNPDGALKRTLTRADLVNGLDAGTVTRAQVLRAIADSDKVGELEFNRAFVAMQYYGYLRRTPEPTGYQSWLDYLTSHPTDFRTMVRGFMDSLEYRARFQQ